MIQKLQELQFVSADREKLNTVFGFMIMLLLSQQGHAQLVNKGDLIVEKNTILSVNMDCDNEATGVFTNDGQVFTYGNYNNDGKVSYSPGSTGATNFVGLNAQVISGQKTAEFQNVVFDNLSDVVPFQMNTDIAVGTNADFKNGIVNVADDNKMIFNENAKHTNVGDQSFVDGNVQKKGKEMFEFPVGNELVFRPSYHAAGATLQDVYTTRYFNQNSGTLYSHDSKNDDSILLINNKEYWKVTKDAGSQRIVLSLSLKEGVTPSEFFEETATTKVAIVRWDESLQKWVNDGGELSDASHGPDYSKLVTSTVGGYGIFTMAIVKRIDVPTDLIVYNAISPNGDGINDTFHIAGIDKYPDNSVEIYNRWGVKVFETKGYNESDNMFGGYSDGRATVKRGDKLPTGTYFYILRYNNNQKMVEKSGYLYINNQ